MTSDADDVEAEYDEYEDVVLGDVQGEEKDGSGVGGMSAEDRQLIRKVSQFFGSADSDGNGTLSIVEFYKYQKQEMDKPREQGREEREARLVRMEKKLDALVQVVNALVLKME